MISIKKLFALTLSVSIIFWVGTATSQKRQAANAAGVEHGRYLVQQVAMCGDCHSPHDDHGQVIEARALQGASLTFKPLGPVPNWVEYAPAIAGLPGFTDEQMVTFLTTGKDPSGHPPRPPMPAYRFNRSDAAAISGYLRSLAAEKARIA